MKVSKLSINNFRGIKEAALDFDGHALLIGGNNVGKSTICEALELSLGLDRRPLVEEFDFYNARYLDEEGKLVEARIEVLLTEITESVQRACSNYLERWNSTERRVLSQGEIDQADAEGAEWCLRLLTIARYDEEEDEFEVNTYYAKAYDPEDESDSRVPHQVKRTFGFLYLRALRTGTRALSLERGSLLDAILRIQGLRTGIWENVRKRLETLDPPIQEGAAKLTPLLQTIEARLAEYIPISKPGEATKLFVSQLTREHLRKTLSFFLSVSEDQKPVPFQEVGTGTLNTLVLALLSFIAELKEENVIFAMEEPEIALPPHTQRRIAEYLLTKTTQCFVTSHSPYIIEAFEADRIKILRRDNQGKVTGRTVELADVKLKTYNRHIRRGFSEAMLGRGVIVVEGLSEQLALQAVAQRLESNDEAKYPMDLAGVTVVTPDGDGGVAEFGRFFSSLDLPTYALLDKKTRTQKDKDALSQAGFKLLTETAYVGLEDLLASELPLDRQWTYLETVRNSGVSGIPATRPADAELRRLTSQVLQGGKGWGRSSELIQQCVATEMPATLVAFLNVIYEAFPRPKRVDISSPASAEPEPPAR